MNLVYGFSLLIGNQWKYIAGSSGSGNPGEIQGLEPVKRGGLPALPATPEPLDETFIHVLHAFRNKTRKTSQRDL
jgi:hypothetical protein